MANSVSEVLLTNEPLGIATDQSSPKLRLGRHTAASTGIDLAAGAIVDFWGIVREFEEGRQIDGIDYEAHEAMARHQMRQIADAAAEKFRLHRVLLHHRIGFVPAGEASLFLRVSAPHRAAAFEASKWIVDELKKKVPIWKRPAFGPSSPRRVFDRTRGKATARQAPSTTAATK